MLNCHYIKIVFLSFRIHWWAEETDSIYHSWDRVDTGHTFLPYIHKDRPSVGIRHNFQYAIQKIQVILDFIYFLLYQRTVMSPTRVISYTLWHMAVIRRRNRSLYCLTTYICHSLLTKWDCMWRAPPLPRWDCRTAAFSPHSENMQGHSPLPPFPFNHSLALPVSFMSGARSF